jgi:hypothetical protein
VETNLEIVVRLGLVVSWVNWLLEFLVAVTSLSNSNSMVALGTQEVDLDNQAVEVGSLEVLSVESLDMVTTASSRILDIRTRDRPVHIRAKNHQQSINLQITLVHN